MNSIHINLAGKLIQINLENDYYGVDFWRRIEKNEYEPDTQGFVTSHATTLTDFMDIGAANGAMTILAALHGARVHAYEPDPTVYAVLEANIKSNPSLAKNIQLSRAAISNEQTEILFNVKSDPEVLSSILFSGQPSKSTKVEVRDLTKEIMNFHLEQDRKLVIKMDIEGAEWKTLRGTEVLETLKKNKALLLLAVHPGFAKPIPKFARHLLVTRAPWLIRQMRDSINLYRNISGLAEIKRTNLNPVNSKAKFALLIISGYHEFIFDFR